MPRTIKTETEVFKYSELSDEAKEKARDWWRDLERRSGDNHFAEYVIEDAATIAEYLGFQIAQRSIKLMSGKTRQEPAIYWSLGYCQSDGASFDATWYRKDVDVKALKEHAPNDAELHSIVDSLAAIDEKYGASAKITEHHYYGTSVDVEYYPEDPENDFDDPICDQTIKEAAKDFSRWIYNAIRKEYEWMMSDECVEEAILCNDYEFTEDGKHYH